MNQAACYIRVSTQEQAQTGVSLAAQEERLMAYCKLADLDLHTFIREEGISGSKPLSKRPGGADLLHMITRKEIDHIVVLKLDRLFRNAEDALRHTRAWDKVGIALHLVDMGGLSFNTRGAMGRLLLTMMAAFAEFERNIICERTECALRFKKSHSEAYSPTPYGYDRFGGLLVPNSDELGVIQKIQEWRQDGRSLNDIATELNLASIPTKKGGRWYASTVRYMLSNDLHKQETV